MATSKPQCDPCSDRGIRNVATSFCTDCEEPLCSSCTDVHLSMKMSKNHHLIDVDVSLNLSANIDRNCEKHPNMPMDFFCTRHDSLCCRSCLASNHRSCENVLPIEVAARNVKRSALFDSISDDLSKIDGALNSLFERNSSHKTKLSQSKSLIKKEIANFKQKILKKIEYFEAKMISDVDAIYQDLERKSDDDMQLLNDKVHITNGLKSQWSTLTQHGSDIQIFVFLHTAKLKIPEAVDCLHDFIAKQNFLDVKFTEEDAWLTLKSLGQVAVVNDNKMKDFTQIKLKSAQTSTPANNSPVKLVLESKINHPVLKDSLMSGIGVTRDGMLVICNHKSNYLILMTADGKHQQNIDLPGSPWNISIDKESNNAYVTFSSKFTLLRTCHVGIVNLTNRKFVEQFLCPGQVSGITTMNDGLAVGGRGEIYLFDNYRNITQTIKVGTQNIYSLCFLTDKLFCCEPKKSTIHMIKTNGEVIFSKQVTGMISPRDVITDKAGLLYIVDDVANKLVRVNQDGSVKDVLLEGNIWKEPQALEFNTDFTKLYVSDHTLKEVFVFSCRY